MNLIEERFIAKGDVSIDVGEKVLFAGTHEHYTTMKWGIYIGKTWNGYRDIPVVAYESEQYSYDYKTKATSMRTVQRKARLTRCRIFSIKHFS